MATRPRSLTTRSIVLSQVTSALSNVTAQGYDQDGNRNSLTNGQANTTTFSFDLGDRLSSVTTASSLATLYSYNSRNLVATITKPSSQQTTNTYTTIPPRQTLRVSLKMDCCRVLPAKCLRRRTAD